jgi:hypothetical protein
LKEHLKQEADIVRAALHAAGHAHLKVIVRGAHLIVCSESATTRPEPRIRLTQIAKALFGLSFCSSNGRWEPAPFTGPATELIEEVLRSFAFHLAP